MKTKFRISIIINIILIIFLFAILLQNNKLNNILTQKNLSSHTYIPKKTSKEWDTDSDKAYYMFINNSNSVEFKTFKGASVLEEKYSYIGNGVYQIKNDIGYLIHKKDSFEVILNKENNLIFKEYIIFDK